MVQIAEQPLWRCPDCDALYSDTEAKQQKGKCWRHPGAVNFDGEPGVPLQPVDGDE